jgi:glycosyltransferase involved in cell wall biosynthesis
VREFDLVHVHMLWTFPGIAAAHACRRAGVPYAISPHGALDPHALTQRALEKKLFLLLGERGRIDRAALLVFATEAERNGAPPWARARPSAVVPHLVEAKAPSPRSETHEVLILGRIHSIKGFDVLVPAMKQVIAQEPRARLVVVGPDEGGYRAQVEAMVSAHGLRDGVRFTGLLGTQDVAAVLARAALLVAPSYQENFGMAVAEAMASGLPVIVSDKVNLAREVSAAEAGLVVPLDSARLAAAIISLLRDPARRARMGTAGRRLVIEQCSAPAVGATLRRAYASIIQSA